MCAAFMGGVCDIGHMSLSAVWYCKHELREEAQRGTVKFR